MAQMGQGCFAAAFKFACAVCTAELATAAVVLHCTPEGLGGPSKHACCCAPVVSSVLGCLAATVVDRGYLMMVMRCTHFGLGARCTASQAGFVPHVCLTVPHAKALLFVVHTGLQSHFGGVCALREGLSHTYSTVRVVQYWVAALWQRALWGDGCCHDLHIFPVAVFFWHNIAVMIPSCC